MLYRSLILSLIGSAIMVLGLISLEKPVVQAQPETATLTIHERGCPFRPADGDWYSACHDIPQGNVAGSTIRVFEINSNQEFTTVADAQGNGILTVPPGTYQVAWRPGDFVPIQVVFCSPSNDPATDLGHPVTLAAGDDVICDYYLGSETPEPTEPAIEPTVAAASVAVTTVTPALTPARTPSGGEATTETQVADLDATGTLTAETDGSTAVIYAGDCNGDFTETEAVATLTNVRPPDGDMAGADGASTVETSFTALDLPLDSILTEDHVLVVFDEDNDAVPLVCGAIGGVVSEDGSLVFGLPVVQESRFSGVAYLQEQDDQTLVTIFLAEELSAEVPPPA